VDGLPRASDDFLGGIELGEMVTEQQRSKGRRQQKVNEVRGQLLGPGLQLRREPHSFDTSIEASSSGVRNMRTLQGGLRNKGVKGGDRAATKLRMLM
jgi:hypothetical protein